MTEQMLRFNTNRSFTGFVRCIKGLGLTKAMFYGLAGEKLYRRYVKHRINEAIKAETENDQQENVLRQSRLRPILARYSSKEEAQ